MEQYNIERINIIINTVCNAYGTTFDQVNINCRKQKYVEVRHAIAYFLKKINPKITFDQIGKIFNPKKHHSTIIYSIKQYENQIFLYPPQKKLAEKIHKTIEGNLSNIDTTDFLYLIDLQDTPPYF